MPQVDHTEWKTVYHVLVNAWELPDNLLELAAMCGKAYEITKLALASGWTIKRWSTVRTLGRLRSLRQKLSLAVARSYEDMEEYVLDAPHEAFNATALLFLLQCNLRAMESTLEEPPDELTPDEMAELARERVLCFDSDPRDYAQVDTYVALFCIASRWFEIVPGDAFWKYLSLLELRAAELVVALGDEETYDGSIAWTAKITVAPGEEELVAASSEYVSALATMFALFARGGQLLKVLSEEKGEPSLDFEEVAPGLDMDAMVEGLRAWRSKEIASYQEASSRKQMEKAIRELCTYPGEKERYARGHQGTVSRDVFAILEGSRPSLQVSWLSSELGKGGPEKLMDEASLGKFGTAVATLKLFDMHCEGRLAFPWWSLCVVVERDGFKDMAKILARSEPVIVQCMGRIDVFYQRKLYQTRTVERALVLWTVIVARKKTYRMVNATWAVGKFDDLVRQWRGSEEEGGAHADEPSPMNVVEVG